MTGRREARESCMGNKGMREMGKTTFREIRSSLGRFMAIFAIIALGVGFFAGLKVTKDAMLATVRKYLNRYGFYDFRIVSTLGFDQENVEAFSGMKDVAAAEGSVSFDILYRLEDGSQGAVKTYSITEELNTLKLVSGRMPQEAGECVADSGMFEQSDIGSTIYLSEDNAQEELEHFACRKYTIVGLVQSPLYLQYERGNTSIGTGRLAGFICLPPEGFDTDYFTDIYVKFDRDYQLYSEEYDTFVQEKEVSWESAAEKEALDRYRRILEEAQEQIAAGKAELEEKKAEGERELADALETLEEAAAQMEEGTQQLESAKRELEEGEAVLWEKEAEIARARVTIAEKEAEMDQGEAVIAGKEAELAEAKRLVDSNEVNLRSAERQLADGKAELRSKSSSVDTMKMLISEGKNQIDVQSRNLAQQKAELQAKVESGEISGEAYDVAASLIERGEQTLAEYQAQLAEREAQLAEAEQQLAEAKQQIAESEQQLNSGWLAMAEAKQQLAEGQAQLAEAKWEIADGRKAVSEAKDELDQGEQAIADGWKELEEGRAALAEKETEFENGKKEYEEGLKEYEDARKEFDTQVADAEREIADAERELAEQKEPDTYVLGRDANIGYVCFESDSNIIEGIANIFPVFFFLVAALVCITTMNRMVEEQRTQIGVLKALGYGEGIIMSKFMIYSGLAAVGGCVFGFIAGTWGFPELIWFCYGMMYRADPVFYVFNWKLAAISFTVSLLCSIGTTWLSCRVELKQVAAALMRPKAPKAGKRVLLEYIPFVWRRLSFLHKVSIRNIFRYKKRLFMMMVGISGCTALLVTGFGIKDSIADVAVKQFQEIQTYDIGISLKEAAGEELEESLGKMKASGVEAYTFVMEKNVDLVAEGGTKSVYLVAGSREDMEPFLNLHTTGGTAIDYPGLGKAVISNRLSEDYNVRIGDMITLRDENLRDMTVEVSGIYENYIYNYVHISEDTWRELTGEEPERKTVYLNLAGEASEDSPIQGVSAHEVSAELMKLEQVANVTVNRDFMERIGNMMASLDIIVVVVILCAAGLAFVVLYNLTNINITERVREIATIKVLGFYKRETAAYVFRENIMLTGLGMLLGLGLGRLLHAFVMNEIRVDLMSFHIYVKPVSYLYSGLLTMVFAWGVNLAMGGRLEGISMTESLKSID